MYIQKELNSEPAIFLDPNSLSEDGTVALSSYSFSEDGSTFAYGLSSKGSDWVTIHFMDVQTNEEYTEELQRVKFSSITWTHDNKGIFYGVGLYKIMVVITPTITKVMPCSFQTFP